MNRKNDFASQAKPTAARNSVRLSLVVSLVLGLGFGFLLLMVDSLALELRLGFSTVVSLVLRLSELFVESLVLGWVRDSMVGPLVSGRLMGLEFRGFLFQDSR